MVYTGPDAPFVPPAGYVDPTLHNDNGLPGFPFGPLLNEPAGLVPGATNSTPTPAPGSGTASPPHWATGAPVGAIASTIVTSFLPSTGSRFADMMYKGVAGAAVNYVVSEAWRAAVNGGGINLTWGGLGTALGGAAISARANFVAGELMRAIGIDGIPGQIGSFIVGTALTEIGKSLVNVVSPGTFSTIFTAGNLSAGLANLASSFGSFLGSMLANMVVPNGDPTMMSIGGMIGGFIASQLATSLALNFVLPLIGTFIGAVLMGALFRRSRPPPPIAGADIDIADNLLTIGNVWSQGKAPTEGVRQITEALLAYANQGLNLVQGVIGDRWEAEQWLGVQHHLRGNYFVFKDIVEHDPEAFLTRAVPSLMKGLEIDGGNVVIKRGIPYLDATKLDTWLKDLTNAAVYSDYLASQDAYDALKIETPDDAVLKAINDAIKASERLKLDELALSDDYTRGAEQIKLNQTFFVQGSGENGTDRWETVVVADELSTDARLAVGLTRGVIAIDLDGDGISLSKVDQTFEIAETTLTYYRQGHGKHSDTDMQRTVRFLRADTTDLAPPQMEATSDLNFQTPEHANLVAGTYDKANDTYSGPWIDADNDGSLNRIQSVGRTDGVLVWDRNKDGMISGIAEMSFADFATNDSSAAGLIARFDDKIDDAGDPNKRNRALTEKDTAFSELKIWIDRNQDGKADKSELMSLEKAGILQRFGYANGAARQAIHGR